MAPTALGQWQMLGRRLHHWASYRRISHIQDAAAQDVGRGCETLMTFTRGDLFRAARRFASGNVSTPHKALVVTGFFIPQASVPAAETDGPAGAAELCSAIRAIGGDAWMVSDAWCAPVVSAAVEHIVPEDHILIAPASDGFDEWLDQVERLAQREGIDTLIYIERVGPAYDGHPRNMSGADILPWTAPLSLLARLNAHMIGIGDGGNEIGMGKIDASAIRGVVAHGEQIACAVATNDLIVSGTSNWGAHALVCAIHAMGCTQVAPLLEEQWHRDELARITAAGGLDGVTRENTPTVDGLSEQRYYAQINELSRLAQAHNLANPTSAPRPNPTA